jgi:hypothetical protein
MAKQKLIPKQGDDRREARERFNEIGSRVFAVPKSKIDERERRWRDRRKHPKTVNRHFCAFLRSLASLTMKSSTRLIIPCASWEL